jgi:hypothetical protein
MCDHLLHAHDLLQENLNTRLGQRGLFASSLFFFSLAWKFEANNFNLLLILKLFYLIPFLIKHTHIYRLINSHVFLAHEVQFKGRLGGFIFCE